MGVKCNSVEYGPSQLSDEMEVLNKGIRTWTGNSSITSTGIAQPYSSAEPNKFRLLMTNSFGDLNFDQPKVDYNVIDTDYKQYSVVYSCEETSFVFFTAKMEYAWIYSRAKTLDGYTLAKLRNRLSVYTDVVLEKSIQDC